MEGITGYVFRNAFAACYGGADTYFTPFLSNPVLNRIELHDILPENNAGINLVPQILTNRVDTFIAIANTLKDYGYTEVNLNLGCPSGTVVAKKRGAGALREPKELDRLLDGIFSGSPLPVSVKTRIGIRSINEWEDILEVYRKYPIRELIIHPRFQKQFYKGEVEMDAYREAYEAYFPEETGSERQNATALCYNGDLTTVSHIRELQVSYPETSAVMLGRGLLRNPELAVSFKGNTPDPARKKKTLTDFLNMLYEGYREEMESEGPALMKQKELWSYLKDYTGSTDSEMKPLWKSTTLAEYRDVVQMLLSRI